MANTYEIGNSVRVLATFKSNNVVTDPTTITLRIKKPPTSSQSELTIVYTYAGGDITKQGTGIYYKDISIDRSGKWYYRFEGTGTCVAADENDFIVASSQVV